MKRKLIVFILTLLLVVGLSPAAAMAADGDSDGYDDNDYSKLRDFLNQPSAVAGKTNGQRINAAYNPDDPSTWTGVEWNDASPKRVTTVDRNNSKWHGRSLAGPLDISGFTALTKLCCSTNSITSVNVEGNTALSVFDCQDNELTSLDIGTNTALAVLYCNNNAFVSLDVSGNMALTNLLCGNNRLNALDVSANPALELLSCGNNRLTTLDVRANTALTFLTCGGCALSSLYLNTGLESLNCDDNKLTTLDISAVTGLIHLSCENNPLTLIKAALSGTEIIIAAEGKGTVGFYSDSIGHAIATPHAGASFLSWTESGATVSTETEYAFALGEGDRSLTANFDKDAEPTSTPGLTSPPAPTGTAEPASTPGATATPAPTAAPVTPQPTASTTPGITPMPTPAPTAGPDDIPKTGDGGGGIPAAAGVAGAALLCCALVMRRVQRKA